MSELHNDLHIKLRGRGSDFPAWLIMWLATNITADHVIHDRVTRTSSAIKTLTLNTRQVGGGAKTHRPRGCRGQVAPNSVTVSSEQWQHYHYKWGPIILDWVKARLSRQVVCSISLSNILIESIVTSLSFWVMAGEHVIFWLRALSSELGTGTTFILGTSESGLRCEAWVPSDREREGESTDTWQPWAGAPLSPISRSVARTLPRRGRSTRTTETTETGCLSGQTGQMRLCHKVYWWRRQDLIKANKDPCVDDIRSSSVSPFWQCSMF